MSEAIKKLIGEDLYRQVVDKVGDKKFDFLDGHIPKHRFDEVNGSKNELKAQIGTLTEQLDALKTKAKGDEAFEAEIAKYKEANEKWEQKYNTSMMNEAIKREALKENARNPEDILAFINRDELSFDQEKGKVKGLSSQLTELKKGKAYLFDLKADSTGTGTKNPAGANDDDSDDWGNLLDSFV